MLREFIIDIVAGVVLGVCIVLFFWLAIWGTPEQMSAEYDAAQAETARIDAARQAAEDSALFHRHSRGGQE